MLIFMKLKQFIEKISIKNKDLEYTDILGINKYKQFIPTIANTHGTDLRKYQILEKDYFACNLMHIGRDYVIPIAHYSKEEPAIISPAYKVFRISKENLILPEYLYLYFKNDWFDRLCWFKTDDSVRGSLSWNDFKNFDIPIPEIEIQEKIIQINNVIETNIDILNEMCENLDEIIKSTFNYYFEEYKPFNEQEFYETPLGEIPKGWNVKPLKDFINFQEGPGIRYWQYVRKNGTKFLNIRCIQDNDLILDNANMISKEESSGRYNHFMLNEWDIVVSSSGTLGRYAIVRKEHLPVCLNTSIIRFYPKISNDQYSYIYSYLTSNTFYQHLLTMSTGSAQLNFGPTHLKQIDLVIPPEEILINYNSMILPIIKRIVSLKKEISLLKRIHNTLIPKLMSGEIDIEDINIER